MKHNIEIHSLYWDNIDPRIVDSQKKVYNHFGLNIKQHNRNGMPHGEWMDEVINKSRDDKLIIFSDIDSFPTNITALQWIANSVNENSIAGVAQTSNHLVSKAKIYASPVLLGFYKKTWRNLGEPSMEPNNENDVGQALSTRAEEYNIKINLMFPFACIKSKWPLAEKGIFGIGTFYDRGYFHLFQSRYEQNIELLVTVANDVVNNKPYNFEKYLSIVDEKSRNFSKFKSVINKFLK